MMQTVFAGVAAIGISSSNSHWLPDGGIFVTVTGIMHRVRSVYIGKMIPRQCLLLMADRPQPIVF